MKITRSQAERDAEFSNIAARLATAKSLLLSKKNVIDVAIGYKEREGTYVEVMCFVVFVEEKKAMSDIAPEDIIPAEIEGIPTDVSTVPVEDELCGPKDGVNTDIERPLVGGVQISNGPDGQGTLGCFANMVEDGSLVLLSNHHVLYGDYKDTGDDIYQPDKTCCCCCTCDMIARNVAGKRPTIGGPPEFVDAAIAKITVDNISEQVLIRNMVKGLGVYQNLGAANETLTNDDALIKGVAPMTQTWDTEGDPVMSPVVPGNRVRKVGRTTGRTIGEVILVGAPVDVNAGNDKVRKYVNQIRVKSADADKPFAIPGDSGSVLIDDQNRIVGLLMSSKFKEKPYISTCNNIHDVLREMKIRIFCPPTADFTFAQQTDALTFQFDASGSVDGDGIIVTYAWDMGNPNETGAVTTYSGVTCTHTFNTPGKKHQITLKVTDNNGTSDRIVKEITVGWPAGGGTDDGTALAAAETGQRVRTQAPAALLSDLKTRLLASEKGKTMAALVEEFRDEIQLLVNKNRKVMVAWQRKQGPAFVAQYLRTIRIEGAQLPKEVNNVPVQQLLQHMATVLEEEGSPPLAAAVREHRLAIFNVLHHHNTLEEIITVIHTS